MKKVKYTIRYYVVGIANIWAKSRSGSIDATIQLVDTMALINKLDARSRFIILKKYFYGWSNVKVATALNVPKKTVEYLTATALDRLDRLYEIQMMRE